MHSYLPGLFNTDIIPSSTDAFWHPVAENLMARPVLVLCPPFEGGSAEEEQLMGILRAGCKLTPEQFNIVFVAPGEKKAWYQLRDQAKPKMVLISGVHPAQLGLSVLFKLQEPNRFDGCMWVPTFPLAELVRDKGLKLQLWQGGLKPIFETKTYGQLT